MGVVTLRSSGNYSKTKSFLNHLRNFNITTILEKYGELGVQRLQEYTPKRTGLTAQSWVYEVHVGPQRASVNWWNTNENDGVPIALIIQYGHGTGTGGYVRGIDYINPALQPVFEAMAEEVWKEVKDG